MKAKFYAFDANGKQARPNASELKITENGIERKIVSVSCPPEKPLQKVSVAMSIDISGSMSRSDFGEIPVELGKLTATTLCSSVEMPPSQFALQTCHDKAYIVHDFTTDRSKILNTIPPVKAGGNNDFVEHLLNNITGLLNIAKQGKYKRVAVLYTDAWWDALSPNELQACIDTCKKYSIEFYAVIYSRKEASPNGIKASLETITQKTGGHFYDGVTSTKAAKDIANTIQKVTQGGLPCEVEWESDMYCKSVEVITVDLKWGTIESQDKYAAPLKALASIDISPTRLFFLSKPVGVRFDTTVVISAHNASFTVTNITSSNPAYDVNPKSFSLAAGERKTLTLSYTPTDSSYNWTKLDVQNNRCPLSFFASATFPGAKPKSNPLKLTHPNGGEVFVAGSDSIITWSGISPADTVKLELSTDNGKNWRTIVEKTTGLSYNWKNIPLPPSKNCLIRVQQYEIKKIEDTVITFDAHLTTEYISMDYRTGIVWSPDGHEIASVINDDKLLIFDVEKRVLKKVLSIYRAGNYISIVSVTRSPDGSRIATSGESGIVVWDAIADTVLFELPNRVGSHSAISWSPVDNMILSVNGYDARIYDATSGILLNTFRENNQATYSADWCADGKRIAIAGGDSAKVWDINSNKSLVTFKYKVSIGPIAWSPDGDKIVTGAYDLTLEIWDAVSGKVLNTLTGNTGWIYTIAWSPDGSKIASSGEEPNIRIWDAATGKLLKILHGHQGHVRRVVWSPDGRKLASLSWDETIKVWDMEQSLSQEDTSDAVFSIVAPSLASQDIDMGQCLVGKNKDSLITSFVQEKGGYQCRVDSIAIIGTDATQFRLASGIPPFVVPANGSHAVEFRFAPSSPGIKTATVLVFTQSGDTVRQTIRGKGVQPTLAVINDVIDFGQIEIGKTKDSLQAVTIKNIGTAPLDITATHHAGPNDKDYTTLAGGGAFSLTPNEERRMDLRFLPSAIGRTSGRLLFDYNGVGSPATVQLFGVGLGGNIALSNDSAYVGEKAAIRIELLNNVKPTTQSGGKIPFRARISSPSFIYLPQDATNVQSTSNGLSFDVERQWDGLGQTLGTFTAKASLGAVEKTELILEDFAWLNSDGSVLSRDVELQDGSFTVLGICYQGGARLLNTQGNVQLLVVQPHPVQNSNAEVEIETVEKGITTLSLYDLTGREIAVIIHREFERGTHRVALNTSDIPSGSYILILQTPTERKAQRMEILH